MVFSPLASPHLRSYGEQHGMHCEPLQSTTSTVSKNSSVGHFHCHTHRCSVPLTLIYYPLQCLQSPESSGSPHGPEGACSRFLQSSYLLLGHGAKSVCVPHWFHLQTDFPTRPGAENSHSSALVVRPPQSLPIKDH